jgi:hypothetical protein
MIWELFITLKKAQKNKRGRPTEVGLGVRPSSVTHIYYNKCLKNKDKNK